MYEEIGKQATDKKDEVPGYVMIKGKKSGARKDGTFLHSFPL